MKQSGNTTQNANLQEFLDSAANAAEYGQRQFYTAPAIAASLFRPLPALRKHVIADLHFGNGALAAASGASLALGIDIDARVKSLRPPTPAADIKSDQKSTAWKVEQADLTRWYGVAAEAGLQFPFITINPPFSLRWYSDRLSALKDSPIREVADCMAAQGEHIDSTLASFLIALDRLLPLGEGFMVCNAITARRFFGDPEDSTKRASHPSLSKFIWLWLEIPGMIFENQQTDFPTAVLYFSRSHGASNFKSPPPLFLNPTTSDPLSIDQALMVPEVFTAHQGDRFRYEYEFHAPGILERFQTVSQEYADRYKGRLPDWNIQLDAKGRLKTYLTPFQHVSKRIPPATAARLHALNGQTPVAMCVTATSRTALREAAECGIWRIHPDVTASIQSAMAAYDAEGAPFYTPSKIQALGWVDEYSTLTCLQPGIGNALPGDACPITCSIESTNWTGEKINLAGNPEDLEYHGKELLVKLTDPAGCVHHFHVRRDESKEKPHIDAHGNLRIQHWHIADLVAHFHIPIPKDITYLFPDRYQENLRIISQVESRINATMAKAS